MRRFRSLLLPWSIQRGKEKVVDTRDGSDGSKKELDAFLEFGKQWSGRKDECEKRMPWLSSAALARQEMHNSIEKTKHKKTGCVHKGK
ncbi:hypothetical protein FRX31_030525 [Thalictrum thalictroides]|uniref:Uncharacterized protein n=1 Tax=Thalictrum thalictroides TaxID=46969 RepID=A0A7J6V4J3_THATH|nr:hypothetical protein FRX31_030525 [Thalictrum thalictroides]